jgi:hypothetical protein
VGLNETLKTAVQTKVVSTFSAAGAFGLAGGVTVIQERIAKAAEATAANTKKLVSGDNLPATDVA